MQHHHLTAMRPLPRQIVAWSTVAVHGVLALLLLVYPHRAHSQPPDSFTITTVAGAEREPLRLTWPALEAVLEEPSGLTFDDDGNLYITEHNRHVVWRLDDSGVLTRVAGNGGVIPGPPGMQATETPLGDLGGVVVDRAGHLHIGGIGRISTVDPEGQLRVEVGTGIPGASGDGGPANEAQLGQATGLALGPSDELYISDAFRVRKVDANGTISTVAGNAFRRGFSGDGGPAADALLGGVFGLAVDSAGNLFIADVENRRVRRVGTDGVITTVAGSGEPGVGGDGGPAIEAQLGFVSGLAVDDSGNLYIADLEHHRVRRVDAAGIISTVAGDGRGGYNGEDIPATEAHLLHPRGLAVDRSGNLYIADAQNHRVRRVDSMGMIATVVGIGDWGFEGEGGPALEAFLRQPSVVAVDALDNLYIADGLNHRVRMVDSTGAITTVAGSGDWGFDGDDGPALSARLSIPWGLVVDGYGNLYITNEDDHRVRMVNASGVITTVAGAHEAGFGGDGGPAVRATFNDPVGLATDLRGNLYIADRSNHRVRMVNPAGVITTVAGTGQIGAAGDGGPATMASVGYPSDVAVDAFGNLLISQRLGVVRKVNPAGVITTVAGQSFRFGRSGDGGPATEAQLYSPISIDVDMFGNLYIADVFNRVVRRVDSAGTITTVAGTGSSGSGGDGGPAIEAQFTEPISVATDSRGNVYVADDWQHDVRKLSPQREPSSSVESLSLWTVESGRVSFSYLSSASCMSMRNFAASGKTYTVERTQWWRRSDSNAPWSPVVGTGREGQVCALVPPQAGEYRVVGEFTVDGARMTFRSANSIMAP